MSKRKPTKRDCIGCKDNFYNGNNEYGIQECWCLKDATLEKRLLIPTDMRPPYNAKMLSTVPSCYRKKGYATVKPEALDSKGFWKR